MTLRQFLYILRARLGTILLILLATIGAALAVSVLVPLRYDAYASVVIDVKAPDPVAVLLPGLTMPFYMGAQLDLINSDRVARKVVKALQLDADPEMKEQWLSDTEGGSEIDVWIAARLMRNLDVKPSRESNVITIRYRANDAALAATIANAFAQAYIDTTIELKVDPAKQHAHWFEGQAKILRDNLEEAQYRLSTYQQKHGIVSREERYDVENARLNELSAQLSAVLGQTAEAQSKRKASNAEMLPEIVGNPLIQQLKADLARNEGRLNELASTMGPNHPEYQRVESLVASLRTKLKGETDHIVRGFATAYAVSKKRESELQAAIDAQTRRVLEVTRARSELGILTRDVEAAQKAYEQVSQRFNQTTLESQATQTNASILTPASKPLNPSFPKLHLNLFIAIFLGALLGVGLALLRELVDRRVRTSEDLTRVLRAPVLAKVGRIKRHSGRLVRPPITLITSRG